MADETMAESTKAEKAYEKLPLWVQIPLVILDKFGISTLIVCVILWAVVAYAIPESVEVVNRYCDAVAKTQDQMVQTQQDIAATQKTLVTSQQQLVQVVQGVSEAASEIVVVQRETKEFMQSVKGDHADHSKKLDTVIQAVVPKTP